MKKEIKVLKEKASCLKTEEEILLEVINECICKNIELFSIESIISTTNFYYVEIECFDKFHNYDDEAIHLRRFLRHSVIRDNKVTYVHYGFINKFPYDNEGIIFVTGSEKVNYSFLTIDNYIDYRTSSNLSSKEIFERTKLKNRIY